jgi:uncharacterized protein YaiI (UPF0178 family)
VLKPTFNQMRNEAWFIGSKHLAFARNANCSQNVITSTHDIADSRLIQFRNHTGGARFQLVLEDDEAQELQV